jgi:putative heme-binding domain-containing protein
MTRHIILLILGLVVVSPSPGCPGEFLELNRGDHICVIGNTLAERMQHHGWLETLLHARFPRHELVIRNLGYSGDELTIRLRSAGFGSPAEHLTMNKADVILAFFGYNESFAGAGGLEKFRLDLKEFIEHTRRQKYNGRCSPQLVLFSPIAHEDLDDPNLPDGSENNARLKLYAQAMAEVAQAHRVPFVDLFSSTHELYQNTAQALTINGIHLNELGDKLLAAETVKRLFRESWSPPAEAKYLDHLRAAVLEKNFHWFHRYRTVDGYSIFGGRADLKFVDGQTNREVMQRELAVLEVMTANRDRGIWAVAQRRDLHVNDENTPPFIPVKTNKPGPGPNGEHVFLGGEAAIDRMTLGEGLKINLFASEEMFPELAKPVQMAFDAKGRLWVAVMPSYPHWKPKEEMNDKVLILEDSDGNGRADKCTVFADKLHVPTGLEFYNGGLFVGQQPDLMYLKDLNGDDVADHRERVLHGIDSADTHHALNSFVLDPGGALYFQEGTFHHTQVETLYGPPVRSANAAVFRYEPRTHRFEVYVAYAFANPHGHVFDRWGQDFVTDGTGNVNYYAAAFSGRLDFPRKHAPLEPIFMQKTRPCPATEILSSRHFPDSYQQNYLVANVIGFQGILRYRIREEGSGFVGDELEPIVQSADPNFRPADIEIGPDGAIYFLDWQNPIIGHMQHNLRDPSRDKTHGRVYRITYQGRPRLTPALIAGQPIQRLLDLLKEPEDRVRYRAKIELGARNSADVIAALKRWINSLDPKHPEYQHHLTEALWVHQYHNVVDEPLLRRMLRSRDYRARAAATRVLCYWRERVSDPLEWLKFQAEDPHPRVRLEAVRACSFFNNAAAAEVALAILKQPMDRYLRYTLDETLTQLAPFWRAALASDREFAKNNPTGLAYVLAKIPTSQLATLPRSRPVLQELVSRHPVVAEQRHAALVDLAKLNGTSVVSELVSAMNRLDREPTEHSDHVLHELGHILIGQYQSLAAPVLGKPEPHDHGAVQISASATELRAARGAIAALAESAQRPLTRQIAYVALMTADGSIEPTWNQARSHGRALVDVLEAIPLIPDAHLRQSAHDRIRPLLSDRAPELTDFSPTAKGTVGRFVRIELPRRGTLALAEVQVFSSGKNIAREGKARQSSVAYGGVAQRAIDGNTSGRYSDNGQAHTVENDDRPWWELDLGSERPLEAIVVWNRSEQKGLFAKRLDGFQVVVLDEQHREVFKRANQSAPLESVRFELAADRAASIRRAAIDAIVSTGRDAEATFALLAGFIRTGRERAAAVRAISRIPSSRWPHEHVRPTIDALVEYLKNLPAGERTQSDARDALQLGNDLAASLPSKQAHEVRRMLRELGIPILVIRPIPHLMLYDRKEIYVEAGRPIEIVFENTDLMPHNLIVARPGSLERVGIAAEKMAALPDAFDKQFIPDLPDVLHATRMLQPRQSDRLVFTVPSESADYPYVCTFPGHWRRMHGVMHVVRSLDEVPPELLAASQQPNATAVRPLVRNWKVADLAPLVPQIERGRDLTRGKHLFSEIACAQCHSVKGVGGQVGPDLAGIREKIGAKKMSPLDLVTEMIEPSKVIDDRYRTTVLELASGQLVSGIIVGEADNQVSIRTNPLDQKGDKPIAIAAAQITGRFPSKVSLMPEGLLNTLTEEEILDLLAYVSSGGE